ncbi:SbcC/MukB-like Walker B domain-containing protein [Sphingobacterium paludis]|uniref:Exonuclease SbcC n=1 Tax=Sphingobacterium paludis TaxID=1476465 RepID=A0A4R7CUW5_9SPHI|nr:AAA family ATPase [Sphingobacterium paludis]TDS12243.1 exonuclease SbcC [Sphingobacterium paludis]
MLPLYLSIEGLYSYQHKQEIDFTNLTEAGLFGIFGKVGSGKSSILEAISFALYGETERLNKQEKRTYNMLNLKSEAACIIFDFINFEQRTFRFVAQWKRRKRFEETTSLERFAYEWKNNEWMPLASADGAEVTRLTYPNFRRTIIIPQGQFKEFLELRGKDRSDMMKEIFNLNRFDLGPKVSQLQRQNNSKIELLKGALSGFETVSTEILQQKRTEFETAQQGLNELKAETSALDVELTRMAESKRLRAELAVKKQEVATLKLDEPKILQQQRDLDSYEATDRVFREVLNQTQRLNKEKEQVTFKLEQLTARKQQTLSRLEEKETQWHKIALDHQHVEQYRRESEDLKLLIYIQKQQEQKNMISKRIEDGKPHLESVQLAETTLKNNILDLESKLDSLKHKKVDTGVLLALESWYQTADTLMEKLNDISAQKDAVTIEISRIQKTFKEHGTVVNTWEQDLKQTEDKWNEQLLELQKEETHVKVQAKLSEFADNLVNGQPCPLCGSLDHPNHMVSDDASARQSELLIKKDTINKKLTALKTQFQELTRSSVLLKEKQLQVDQLVLMDSRLKKQREEHASTFRWNDFTPEDKTSFLAYKNDNILVENNIKLTEDELKDTRSKAAASQMKLEKYRATIAELEQSLVVIDSLVQQSENQLQILKAEDFAHHKESVLVTRKQEIDNRVQYLEDTYKSLTEAIQQLKTAFAAINGERAAAKEQFQNLYQQLSARQAEISASLKEHGFEDIIQVQQILQKQIHIEHTRKIVQDFNVSLQISSKQLAELEEKTKDDGYDDDMYQDRLQLHALKKEELELRIRVVGALEKECARLKVEFEKKEKLLEEYEKLLARKSNLTTLENLFRGSGFVNYVSSIHLQRLCEIANQRFHRLTRNNLSLTINESNEFEVIDFLNNGFRRSVKTLSGGQSFQASLCLALALAESIQALNNADKNFFFIDEGFGTQDAESMNTVFETLQYLHRENRIVGIISHVEELKERIPRSAYVVNDKDKGSIINYSN